MDGGGEIGVVYLTVGAKLTRSTLKKVGERCEKSVSVVNKVALKSIAVAAIQRSFLPMFRAVMPTGDG